MTAEVELLPCPFCAAGKTEIRENGRPWLGQRYGDPSSVSVRHWCEPIEGQPARMIERVGRDRAAAVAAWNRRATAARDAEIEALRAEVAAWRELSDHVRVGACAAIWPDRYTDARTRDVAAALKRAARLEEALREVMLWIENWSPPFTEDDEWPDTEAKAQAALHPAAAQENNDA